MNGKLVPRMTIVATPPRTAPVSPALEASKLFIRVLKARRQHTAALDTLAQAASEEAELREHLANTEAQYRAVKTEAGR